MDDLPSELLISLFLRLDRYSLGQVYRLNKKLYWIFQSDHLWKQLVHKESDMERIKGFESEVLAGSKTWKDIYRDLHLFVWDADRMSADFELTNKYTIHRRFNAFTNPAAYGKQTLLPSRNYLEFKILELGEVGRWACLGFTSDNSVSIDDGGVFGYNNKTTCAVFDSNIRTFFDDFKLPEPLESGNVVGFHLNFENNTVTIFKNSNLIARVKLAGSLKESTLYPVVGMSLGSVIEFTQQRNPPPVTSTEFLLVSADETNEYE